MHVHVHVHVHVHACILCGGSLGIVLALHIHVYVFPVSLSQASNMTVQLFTVPSLVSHSCIISVLRSYNPECVQPTLCFAGENQLVYQLGLLFHSLKP